MYAQFAVLDCRPKSSITARRRRYHLLKMGQYLTRIIQAVMRPVVRLAAKRASRISAGAGRIDTHIHCLPPQYLAELNKAGVSDKHATQA